MDCACGCGQDAGVGARGTPNRWRRGHHNRKRGFEPECSVEGCDRTPESHGLCHSHAEYLRRTGKRPTTAVVKDPLVRFWSKVERTEGCWLWRGSTDGDGRYGGFWNGQRVVRAHRFAYEAERGPIPDGLSLDHLCRVTLCVRPDHLEPVTQRTNVLRGEAPSAINAAKVECIHGHPLDIVEANGTRDCRTCRRERAREAQRRYRARQRQKGHSAAP